MSGATREAEAEISLGMVGVSEGNGHPYSFSSIVNGYSETGLKRSGWDVIYEYVRRRDPSEFGFEGARVTHAWTQDDDETRRLCEAARIPTAVADLDELIGAVDGVIVARDDHERHFEMAMPFLEAGMSVFVDKPLSLDPEELSAFDPYLEDGSLMSCSGLRYARELDSVRADISEYGDLKLIRGAVINDWERYGVHLLDAIYSVVDTRAESVRAIDAAHPSFSITMQDGTTVQIDTLGDVPKTFSLEFFGTQRVSRHELEDNFTAFRRTLWRFVESIRREEPTLPPADTRDIMAVLIAGRASRAEERAVRVDEIPLTG